MTEEIRQLYFHLVNLLGCSYEVMKWGSSEGIFFDWAQGRGLGIREIFNRYISVDDVAKCEVYCVYLDSTSNNTSDVLTIQGGQMIGDEQVPGCVWYGFSMSTTNQQEQLAIIKALIALTMKRKLEEK